MPPEGPATAEGDLGRTPFAHLLVYAVDRRLTGALFLVEPSGVEHVVRFAGGVPVKVRPGDGYARFGELLLEERAISPETLSDALATTGLLGDVLLLSGCLDTVTLDGIAQTQFVRRMIRLFELPPETTYRYFDGHDALADWGGDAADVDPLAILWAGLREHGHCSTWLVPTLERLGATPLRLHTAFEPGRLGLRSDELALVAAMQDDAPTLPALFAMALAPERTLQRLVYALFITRAFDLGASAAPVGVGSSPPPLSAASQALGRVQLRATVHRVGAAAPDPAGDGERAPVPHRSRRRDRPAQQPPLSASVAATLSSAAADLAYPSTHATAPRERTSSVPAPPDGDRESGVPASAEVEPPSRRRMRSDPPDSAVTALSDSAVHDLRAFIASVDDGAASAPPRRPRPHADALPLEPVAPPAPMAAAPSLTAAVERLLAEVAREEGADGVEPRPEAATERPSPTPEEER